MRIFNFDGLEFEMCGNGIRCLVKFIVEFENNNKIKYNIYTGVGIIVLEL